MKKIDTHAIKNAVLNFIIPIICTGASLAIFFIVIYPSIKNTPLLQAELDKKMKLSEQLSTKLSRLNKLLDYNSVVDEDLDLVSTLLVSEPTVPELLTQVDAIATESGLVVTRLNYATTSTSGASTTAEASTASTGSSYTIVSLGTEGNYVQLLTFLDRLENSARIVEVEDIRYAIQENAEGAQTLGISLTLKSPYMTVKSDAITDDPIQTDITAPDFTSFIDEIKTYKVY